MNNITNTVSSPVATNNKLTAPKKAWKAPAIENLDTDVIKQQEDELMTYLMNNEGNFKLLSGSILQ